MNEQNPVSPEATTAELQERINELTNINAFLQGGIESWGKRFKKLCDYVQGSIDNGEWSDDELQEPFWEYMADELDLDLKLTEEVEVTVTVTYSGTVTVDKGTEVSDLEVYTDLPWNLSFIGNHDSNVNYDDIDISLM